MEKLEDKSKFKIIFVALVIAFISPSIAYMLSGRTINELVASFNYFYTNTYTPFASSKIIGAIFFIGIFSAISYVYYIILKNHKEVFKNNKQIVIFIIVVASLFVIMLPLTSTDVFYYIGTGWSEAHYRSKSLLYFC